MLNRFSSMCLGTVLVGLGLSTAPSAAQPVDVELQAADGTALGERFSLLNGARELSNGRVLVSDWIEERVALVDFATGEARAVGQIGAGPSELRLPNGLIPFVADSTLLVDLGNRRFAVVGPDGRIHRTIRIEVPGAMGARGADAEGALYYEQPGWATGAPPNSTAPRPLVRWLPGAGDPVEIERVDTARPRSDAGQPRRTPGIPFVMFAPRDGWAVGLDGTVAIVRWDPYRVEWLGPGGRSVSATIAVEPREVTGGDKEAFVRRFLESTPTSGRGPDGGLGQSKPASDQEVRELVETNDFATHHAPFDPSTVRMAPNGSLWVGRTAPTRTPSIFDVFAPGGDRIAQVTLPRERTLLAVSDRFLYAVVRDELDLETLERYEIPPLP